MTLIPTPLQNKALLDKEGLLIVDKGAAKTTFYLVKLLRHLTGIKKIGHAGTLDPFATGLVVMLIGKPYTKLSDQFLNSDKEYTARIKFGEATDSYDCDGVPTHTSQEKPALEEVEHALTKFQGTISQVPPMFSAKKVKGKKLYEYARQGISIEREAVPVTLHTTLIAYNYPYLDIQISCSKGTYIRSIANDLGHLLNCYGHLVSLRRTRSGSFTLDQAIPMSALTDKECDITPYLIKSVP